MLQGGGGFAPRTSSGGGTLGGGAMLQNLSGGREVRYNRLLDKMGSPSILFKVPESFGTDENNVVLGLSNLVALAAAATGTCQVNVPRDLILRKLIVVNNILAGDVDFVISAITIEGNSVLLGNPIGGAVFSPTSFYSPSFDLPVAGGTPVTISITNTSAAAQDFSPCFTID
jgi:hypothetical protein